MSRNLGDLSCAFCFAAVKLAEAPRLITRKERGPYEDYDGMVVANAECVDCAAPYLAWVDESQRRGYPDTRKPADGFEFVDLSHRHAFNDEPSWNDYPRHEVKRETVVTVTRVAWPTCYYCGGPLRGRGESCARWDRCGKAQPT